MFSPIYSSDESVSSLFVEWRREEEEARRGRRKFVEKFPRGRETRWDLTTVN